MQSHYCCSLVHHLTISCYFWEDWLDSSRYSLWFFNQFGRTLFVQRVSSQLLLQSTCSQHHLESSAVTCWLTTWTSITPGNGHSISKALLSFHVSSFSWWCPRSISTLNQLSTIKRRFRMISVIRSWVVLTILLRVRGNLQRNRSIAVLMMNRNCLKNKCWREHSFIIKGRRRRLSQVSIRKMVVRL